MVKEIHIYTHAPNTIPGIREGLRRMVIETACTLSSPCFGQKIVLLFHANYSYDIDYCASCWPKRREEQVPLRLRHLIAISYLFLYALAP